MAPLYNPRLQRLQEHFTWDAEFTQIIGVTPTGRATVASVANEPDWCRQSP